jgi:hypothetical protein
LFRDGESPEGIALRRMLSPGTILGHLSTAIEAGETLDLRRFYSEQEEAAIAAAFSKCGYANLTGTHETLNAAFDMGVLQLFRAAAKRGLVKS